VATLAEKRNFSHQEFGVIASVNFVAVQTVLLNRGMLKGIGPPFFRMTFITEVIDRIGFHHFLAEPSVHLMATGAFDSSFVDRMVRLFVLLGADIFVAGVTEIRFLRSIGFSGAGVDRMTLITGDPCSPVFADVPGGKMFRCLMAGKAPG
jgi:hypothetical protein